MKREIPAWMKSKLAEGDLARIEAAVAEAEKRTSGEIVPMVVRSSSTVGHVPVILFLAWMLLFLWFELPDHVYEWTGADPLVVWLGGFVLGLVVAGFLSRLPLMDRWLTPRQDQEVQVNERAELEFYGHGLGRTKGKTGILIFASLMEHRAVVLADEAIASKLDPSTWNKVIELLLGGIRRGSLADGYSDAIRECGEILAGHFPIEDGDVNELRNHLVMKE